MNEFLQFYLKKYFDLFSFKKSNLYKLLIYIYIYIYIYITLFAKEFLNKN